MAEIKNVKGQPDLKFYLVEDIDLQKFTKYENENKMKYPEVTPNTMSTKKFVNFVNKRQKEIDNNIKNTETIVSPDGKLVNEDSFEILMTLGKGYFGRVFLVEKKDTK